MDATQVSMQIDKLRAETERLAERPAWYPILAAAAFVGGVLLVARGLVGLL